MVSAQSQPRPAERIPIAVAEYTGRNAKANATRMRNSLALKGWESSIGEFDTISLSSLNSGPSGWQVYIKPVPTCKAPIPIYFDYFKSDSRAQFLAKSLRRRGFTVEVEPFRGRFWVKITG